MTTPTTTPTTGSTTGPATGSATSSATGTPTPWTQSRACSGLVQILLDVRLVGGLLSLCWAWIDDQPTAVLLGISGWMVVMLVMLLRWKQFAALIVAHPLLHLVDLAVLSLVLAETGVVGPVAFLLVSGGLFTGLCLGIRGAWYFTPVYLLGWLLPATMDLPMRSTDPGVVFLVLVVVPILLATMLFGGALFQHGVIAATQLELALHEERETSAIAEERARLAREMHDSVTKSVQGIAMLADALPTSVRSSQETALLQADQIARAARVANREARELLVAMRRTDGGIGVGGMLRRTVQRWEATHGRPVTTDVTEVGPTDPATLYEMGAIVNEALENVARHTPPDAAVRLTCSGANGWITVAVADDGPGIDPAVRADAGLRGHFGLVGMEERAARIGGRLALSSEPGAGTAVTLRVPLGAPR